MSSLNIVVRNLPSDPPNILRGTLRNPLKLSPNSRIGLSSINISRGIGETIINMDSAISIQTKGGPLFHYKVKQGIYAIGDLLTATQLVLNKSCIPWCNRDQAPQNNSLFGFNPVNNLDGSKITGLLIDAGHTFFKEIKTLITAQNVINVVRYSSATAALTNGNGSDFTNVSANVSFANPAAGQITILDSGNPNFSVTFNKKQSIGAWCSSVKIGPVVNQNLLNATFTLTNGTSLLQYDFVFTYSGINLTSLMFTIYHNTKIIIRKTIPAPAMPSGMYLMPYRIGGRLGFIVSEATSVWRTPNVMLASSVEEPDDVSKNWSSYTLLFSGFANFGSGGNLIINGINQVITAVPSSTEFTPLNINYDSIKPNNAQEIANALFQTSLNTEKNEQLKRDEEELGILISDVHYAPANSQIQQPENLNALPDNPDYFIPSEMAIYLGFNFSGVPVSGVDPPYIFDATNPVFTISGDFPISDNSSISPLIIASRSIPLRGNTFLDNGDSSDLSVLDSVVAIYSDGITYAGNFRPPLYATVNNKNEMVISDLRFDLLDIDGISPFEVLPGAVIVINIQGAL